MEEKLKGILKIIIAILFGILAFFFSPWIAENFAPWGYIGVFFFSLISSATIFLPMPSWILVFSLAASFNPIFLGISAGFGAALGELTGYYAGFGGASIIGQEKINLLREHKKWLKKAECPFLFVLALIPNPFFDIAGIAAGIMQIPVWRFLLAVALGKTLRFILLAYIGYGVLDAASW